MTPIRSENDRDKANFYLQLMVAVSVLFINTILLFIIAQISVPDKNDAAFNIFLGNAMGWFGALMAFSFPNSIGSAKKDDTISKLADKAPTLSGVLATDGQGKNATQPDTKSGEAAGGGTASGSGEPAVTGTFTGDFSLGSESEFDIPKPPPVDSGFPWNRP